jgi:hypothetical protein
MKSSFSELESQIEEGSETVAERVSMLHSTTKESSFQTKERHDRALGLLTKIDRRLDS